MRVLTRNVTIHVDGEPVSIGPGACPDRLARLIQMPGIWADSDGQDSDEAPVGRPAKNGTRDDWAAYAESLELDVDDDMSRNDIIALVDSGESDDAEV